LKVDPAITAMPFEGTACQANKRLQIGQQGKPKENFQPDARE
jgi:hypothetical protein